LNGQEDDEEEDVSSYWITFRKEKVLEIVRGSTILQCLENCL
jgi:hypothetical protein